MCAMEGFFHSAVLKLGNSPPRNALPGSFSMRVSRTESIDFNSPAVSRRRRESEIHDLFSTFLSWKAIEWFRKTFFNPYQSQVICPCTQHKCNNSDESSWTFRCPLCRRSGWDDTGGQICPWCAWWEPEWLNRYIIEATVFLIKNSGFYCRAEQQAMHNLVWKNY